jgi:hypothetical protein
MRVEPMEILDSDVQMTVLGGRIVHEKNEQRE